MDRRRQSIMNIGDPSDSGEVVKITDVKEHFLSFFELIDYAETDWQQNKLSFSLERTILSLAVFINDSCNSYFMT